jgi:hypothetical protein
LSHPSADNSSYSLEFWGTTLDCDTKARTIERFVTNFDIPVHHERVRGWNFEAWQVRNLATSDLRWSNDPSLLLWNTTITHRIPKELHEYSYYPCLSARHHNSSMTDNATSGYIDLPRSGIHIFVPITETVCHPKIVRYHVLISHTVGTQYISYSTKIVDSIPEYTSIFDRFGGSFEQFTHFSDAVALYLGFAVNLNHSHSRFMDMSFGYPTYPEIAESYSLSNGSTVQACLLRSAGSSTYTGVESSDLWPLSVFEQRLGPSDDSNPLFDSKMANELLINTAISALSLNERFDVVNGTESRNFNIYHFQNKLAFFLPYGLSLGLAIPVITLGLIALYVQNHGVSAISGGFVQLLMTTTGRTAMESVIKKKSATLGGYENVSQELREMEIRFGELVNNDDDECRRSEMTEFQSNRRWDSAEGQERSQDEIEPVVGGLDRVFPIRRAGFGTAQDVRPLRRRVTKSNA